MADGNNSIYPPKNAQIQQVEDTKLPEEGGVPSISATTPEAQAANTQAEYEQRRPLASHVVEAAQAGQDRNRQFVEMSKRVAYSPHDKEAMDFMNEENMSLAASTIGSGGLANAPGKTIKLTHYSNIPGIKQVDPKFSGSGFDAGVKGRSMEVPQAFHYLEGTTPETQTALGQAKYKYSSEIPAEHVYDLSKDTQGIVEKAIQDNQGVINMSEIQKAVRDAGFKGSMVSAHPDASLSKTVTMFEPLPVSHVNGEPVTKNLDVRSLANDYAKSQGLAVSNKPSEYVKNEPHIGKRIAEAYETMPHNPNDPNVKRAYDALVNETQAQYKMIKDTGIKIEPMPADAPNPYPNGSKDLFADIDTNKHMWYYPTEHGFGSQGAAASDHPLLQPTPELMNGKPMLANDMFRIVHDVFGHIKERTGFGPRGEENAWREHMKMFSPEAQKALTTETRGQNSWVNYGPHGENNRANPAKTVYAEQKAGLLPEWAMKPTPQESNIQGAKTGLYSKAASIAEEKMGGKASAEQIRGMLKEVKPEEMQYLGIDDFLKSNPGATKEQLLEHIRSRQPEIKTIEKGGSSVEENQGEYFIEHNPEDVPYPYEVTDWAGNHIDRFSTEDAAQNHIYQISNEGEPTKYSQYALPGGENYREILHVLPSNIQKALKIKQNEHGEFDVVNKEGRTLATMSDVGDAQQYIKEEGLSPRNLSDYRSSHWDEPNVLAHTRVNDRIDTEGKKNLFVEEIQSDWHQAGREQGYKIPNVESKMAELKNKLNKLNPSSNEWEQTIDEINKLHDSKNYGVPDAPFKKTWHEFTLKKLIREASEKGYDRLSWTTGEQQASRYDLSKKINRVELHDLKPANGEGFELNAIGNDGHSILKERISDPTEAEKYIGKDAAKKLQQAKTMENDRGIPVQTISGLDLSVGGEGMKGFYDKIIPEYLSKLGKKYGAKVGQTELPALTWDEIKRYGKQTSKQKIHYLELTPELKRAALEEGFPMFAIGGMVSQDDSKQNYAEGGTVVNQDDQSNLIPMAQAPQPMAPAQQMINVIDPDTQEIGSIPAHQLEDAISQGYTQATPEQTHAFINQSQYGSPSQQLLSGMESAASAATFGLSTGLERAAGVSSEGILGRKEANPITSGLGSVGGLAASSLIPGVGAVRLLSQAGRAAAEAVGLGAAGGSLIKQMGREAVKGAFETTLFQGGEEVSKAFAKDPNQSAETAIIDLGLAGIMGGTFGAAIGAGLAGLSKLKGGAKLPESSSSFVSEMDRAAFDSGDFKASIENNPALKEDQKLSIMAGLSKEKSEAPEIRAAAKRLGANVMEGMVSDSPTVQAFESSLINGKVPTYSGMRRTALYDAGYTKAEAAVEQSLGDPSRYSKAELGNILKDSITSQIAEENAPIAALYNELKQYHEIIPLSEKSAPAIARNIGLMQELKLSPSSPEGALMKRVMSEIGNLKTVDDVKAYKDILSHSISPTASSGEKRMASILRDKLTDLEESSIERFARKQMKTPEAKARIEGLIDQRKAANAQYKQFIEKVKTLSEQLGKGRVYGVQDALNFIREKLTPEEIASRVFSKKDSEFNAFFNKHFPDQMALVREFQKGALRAEASKTGALQPKLIFNQVNKLEPEIQKSIFTKEELQKLKDAETYIRAIPKDFNPSGTSHMQALREFMESPIKAGFANIRDLGIEKFITTMGASPEVQQAVALAKATARSEKLLKNSVKAIFKAERVELPEALKPSDKKREKLDKLVLDLNKNPQKLLNLGENNPVPEYNQAFAQVSQKAIEYLNSMRAVVDPQNPLDSKRVVSAVEKARYNRALDIAQQPLLVLENIKNGTLIPEDVKALNSMYPNLYNKMSQQLTDQIVETTTKGQTVPYKTRLMLSTFLGKPMDSTMTPEGIMGAQPMQAAPEQPQGAPSNKNKTGTALNKMPSMYQTKGQARTAKENKD